METKYYIKEFSETFGISTATLRYYDKIGLMCAKREESNLYRYYTEDDCYKIMMIRILRSFGLSVHDIRNHTWLKDRSGMTNALDEEMQRIDHQIRMLSLKNAQLAYYRRITECIREKRLDLGVEHLDSTFLFYAQMVNHDVMRPGDPCGITSDLYDCMPLCMAGELIEEIASNACIQRYGLIIKSEHLPPTIAAQQIDETISIGACLHVIIPGIGHSEADSRPTFEVIRQYASANGHPNVQRALCMIIPSPETGTGSYLDCYILI